MKGYLIPFVAFILFVSACNNNSNSEEHFVSENNSKETKQVKELIYSMYLPTDMTNVFSNSGVNYNPNMPAPIDNIMMYTSSEQISLMLGIYGVDITYMKLLGQNVPAAQYYKAIESLSAKLNIPESIFEESANQLEKYFNEEDSLASVINKIYTETDAYYKKNNMDNFAALSLVGGWVEAMYFGVMILETDDNNFDMTERLLQQKFSLNSIYTLLSNHQESIEIKEYLLLLKKLKKIYDNVEIKFQKEGFNLDKAKGKIQTTKAEIIYSSGTVEELCKLIKLVRNEMIEHK